jgi:hypothetical protein
MQWEKKTDDGTVHDVDNRYNWSTGAPWDPNGTAFTDFLASLNSPPCFAGHCDWQLPTAVQFSFILIGPSAGPGQPDTCPAAPCISPEFAAVGGPTSSSGYWSTSTGGLGCSAPEQAWYADFSSGNLLCPGSDKTNDKYVRAVRNGRCP